MWEICCFCVIFEVVLKVFGYVDKFIDLMVKDLKLGFCFWVDYLLKDFFIKVFEDDVRLVVERVVVF